MELTNKEILKGIAKKKVFIDYVVSSDSELYQEFLTTQHKYTFDNTHLALKEFLENNGFKVREHGEKPTHFYAITECNIYLSSNGMMRYIEEPKRTISEIINPEIVTRQKAIENMLLSNGFNSDMASDSAYLIIEDRKENLSDLQIIEYTKKLV